MKYALILVDMLNDFVTGKLGCGRARSVIKPNKKLINFARKNNIPIFYANDNHISGVDYELKLWGDHAIIGTDGAKVIDELKPSKKDYIINKHCYSGFFQTDLHWILKQLGITSLIITGLHTHLCCRHTSADAYQYGYEIIIPKDATNSFTENDYQYGLDYLKQYYNVKITTVDEIIKKYSN